jgi:hypothetical protein
MVGRERREKVETEGRDRYKERRDRQTDREKEKINKIQWVSRDGGGGRRRWTHAIQTDETSQICDDAMQCGWW